MSRAISIGIPALVCWVLTLGYGALLLAAEPAENDPLWALNHLAGHWKNDIKELPSRATPNGGTGTDHELAAWTLGDRFLLGRIRRQQNGLKTLWLATYDQQTQKYPLWAFSNAGIQGGQWRGTWDAQNKSLDFVSTDVPPGWTSAGKNEFPDANTTQVDMWIKNNRGETEFAVQATKTRQTADWGKAEMAAWTKNAEPTVALPAEIKQLEQLIGIWDCRHVSRRAEWTPAEIQTTIKIQRQWILDGWFVQDTTISTEKLSGLSLFSFDPQSKRYRSWWFSDAGHHNTSYGDWDDKARKFTFAAKLPNGLTSASTGEIQDADHQTWYVRVTDTAGKVYFDGEWNLTRAK
ncbi:MAG: DUF1579 family protein [Pirellulales bacterium]|nr:DUF1579 family protein [Pirellulales bacterium]